MSQFDYVNLFQRDQISSLMISSHLLKKRIFTHRISYLGHQLLELVTFIIIKIVVFQAT